MQILNKTTFDCNNRLLFNTLFLLVDVNVYEWGNCFRPWILEKNTITRGKRAFENRKKASIIRIYSDLSPITPTTPLQGVKFEKKVPTVVNHTLEAPIMQN